MSAGAERPLDRALEETTQFVKDALKRAAPTQGVIDLPPYDQRASRLSHQQRREIALAQLPTPIPLPIRADDKRTRPHPGNKPLWIKRILLWTLFALTVVSVFRPEISLVFGAAWLIVLIWPTSSSPTSLTMPPVVDAAGAGHSTEFEIRVIWMARWQASAIVDTRAWDSEELAGGVGKIDLADVLGRLTERALNLLRFTTTAPPMPSRSQPELRRQWHTEQQRIDATRTDLMTQVAALIVYREHLELISDLLDRRDQMAVYSERAAAFDDALPLSADERGLLDAANEQRDLHTNLASQLKYLDTITNASPARTSSPLIPGWLSPAWRTPRGGSRLRPGPASG